MVRKPIISAYLTVLYAHVWVISTYSTTVSIHTDLRDVSARVSHWESTVTCLSISTAIDYHRTTASAYLIVGTVFMTNS